MRTLNRISRVLFHLPPKDGSLYSPLVRHLEAPIEKQRRRCCTLLSPPSSFPNTHTHTYTSVHLLHLPESHLEVSLPREEPLAPLRVTKRNNVTRIVRSGEGTGLESGISRARCFPRRKKRRILLSRKRFGCSPGP